MQISNSGIDFIKKWEELRLTAYRDVKGILTIGYGHTKNVREGMSVTVSEAENLLKNDLQDAENSVNYYLRGVELSQNQYDALVSLVFNVGSGTIFTKIYNNGYVRGSSLYNLLLQGEYEGAVSRFTDFVNAGGVFVQGLKNRRLEEAEMFKKKVQLCPSCGSVL